MWDAFKSVFAVIIEGDRVVEVRPTSMEELAAWMDQRQSAEQEGVTMGTLESPKGEPACTPR
jgi:hypothetical protein